MNFGLKESQAARGRLRQEERELPKCFADFVGCVRGDLDVCNEHSLLDLLALFREQAHRNVLPNRILDGLQGAGLVEPNASLLMHRLEEPLELPIKCLVLIDLASCLGSREECEGKQVGLNEGQD